MRDQAVFAAHVAEQMRLEPERLAAEVRYVLSLDWQARVKYLDDGKLRSKAAGDRLRAAVAEVQSRAVPA